jgi:hypothetical protein
MFFVSLGRSTGEDAFRVVAANLGDRWTAVGMNGLVLEPVRGLTEQKLLGTMRDLGVTAPTTATLTGYCRNFRKQPPRSGIVYRVAEAEKQRAAGLVPAILESSRGLRDAGELHPDSRDANDYFHSIRQWAIWTDEQGFDERTFAEALLEHTRKNVAGAGRKWTKEIEAAARSIVPNRWRDVGRVLQEAKRLAAAPPRPAAN